MPKYFLLESYGPDDQECATIESVFGVRGVNWLMGSKFTEPIPTPIRITLNPEGGLMMPVFKRGILLFSDKMIAGLRSIGVNNIDCYETEIESPATDERYTNYKAVNIIGLVSAADMEKSEHEIHGAPIADVDFDSLVIDESRTFDLLMFRLAECVTGIVVHEKVKVYLESIGITDIDWIEPKDWFG